MAADQLEQLFQQEMLMATAGRNAADAYEKLAEQMNKSAAAARAAAAVTAAAAKAQKEWEGKIRAVNDALDKTNRLFAIGTASVLGFVAAASPAAFQTLTGSIQLLAGSIGQAFIPQIVKVSAFMQDAAHWVQHLDDATKDGAAKWLGYALALGAAVKAFSVIKGLAGGPIALGTVAAGAVVANAAASQFDRDRRKEAAYGDATGADLNGDADIQKIVQGTGSQAEKQAALKALQQKRAQESQAATKDAKDKINGFQKGWGLFGAVAPSTDEAVTKAAEAAKAAERATAALQLAMGGKALSAGGAKSLLATAIQKEMAGGFTGIDMARKHFQTAGLQMSPLEQEQLELQRKSYLKLLEIANGVRGGLGAAP